MEPSAASPASAHPASLQPATSWWQPPRLHEEEEQGLHRKVSWLELFYDLVYVVAVAEVAHGLAAHPGWMEFGKFCILFAAVWWVWMGGTFYVERFESRGIENRLIFLLMMVSVAGLALFAGEAIGKDANYFAASYVFARALIYGLWLRGSWHNAVFRPVGRIYARGLAIGLLIWLASMFVDGAPKYAMWIVGIFVDAMTPAFTMRQQARLPRYSSSKLPERFGLFTILVLGESVAGSIHGLIEARRTGLSGEALAYGLIGIGIAFGLWWIYFDFIARRAPVAGRWRTYLWAYSHLPLWLGLTATGACIRALIETQTMQGTTHGIESLVAISMAVALLTMAFVEPLLQRAEYEPFHRRFSPLLKGFSALVVMGIGCLPISGLVAMLLWLFVLALNALYGAWRWFQKPEAHAHYQG